MTVTATGVRAVAAGKLATMVSQSATFIARVSALNAAAALQHVHYPWLQKNKSSKRPCAIITHAGLDSDLNSSSTYVHGGQIRLRLLDTARHDDKSDSETDFTNFADGVLSDLLENSRTNTTGLLTIQHHSDEGVMEVDPTENSEFANHFAIDFLFDWAPFQG
jgi:hypothetical protein